MIAPDMATMLAFVVTDAALPAADAAGDARARRPTPRSTRSPSTATPRPRTRCCCSRPERPATPRSRRRRPALADFRAALDRVLLDWRTRSCGTARARRSSSRSRSRVPADDASARRIGLAIANSPLVKTAIAGGDANWGRVVMAVGKSGEPVDRDRLGVAFGGHAVARDGAAVPDLDEAPVAAHLAGREIAIGVDGRRRAGRGHGVDLRPHPRLHRHQCRLPLLSRRPVCARPRRRLRAGRRDGRVLVAQRPAGKPMAGLWEFPGGKLQPGETPEAAPDPRAARGAGHRHRGELPRTADLRLARL